MEEVLGVNDYGSVFVQTIKPPQSKFDAMVDVEEGLKERRPLRTYKAGPFLAVTVSQPLWAVHSISEPSRGLKIVLSAHVSYLIKEYLITSSPLIGTFPEMYNYLSSEHGIKQVFLRAVKDKLYNATRQGPISSGHAILFYISFQDPPNKDGSILEQDEELSLYYAYWQKCSIALTNCTS